MPPSQESRALEELFKTFATAFAAAGDNSFLARCIYDQVQKAGSEAPGVSMGDATISANGLTVPCKWFRPAGTEKSKHVMLFMHGGGFSFGSPNGHRKLTAHLAKACDCPALSVDYRLTPENPYPASLDDCVAAYQHLLDSGYDASKIVVAGDSVGGQLATTLPLACMKRGLPVPGASVSLSPCYDMSTQQGGTMDTNEQNDVLNTKDFVKELSNRLVGDSGVSKTDPLISPLYASEADVKRLPPHWISIGGYDMLRDHGERMGANIKKAGIEVVIEVHEGQQHVMEFMAGKAPEATGSIERIGKWVQEKMR